MATKSADGYEHYYVPEQSAFPILATVGLFFTVFGAATFFNEIQSGDSGIGGYLSLAGLGILFTTLFYWFRQAITENMQGLNSAQMKRSYVWGMGWFIFSEVMFFVAFFGALFYVRNLAGPWLGGEGDKGKFIYLLWENYRYAWPMMETPDQVVNGAKAVFVGAGEGHSMYPVDAHGGLLKWLPMWNTIILLSSSVTVHIAHVGLKDDNRKKFTRWLGITVLLAVGFLYLQYAEYHEAYVDLGLTLESGIYGTTFFMLTGFHGFHVFLGMTMLAIMWLRARKGHFSHEEAFGFEAASWYWHFVDVVWVCLFFFVYII
ncbi:cytochrome c oxidase subunit 3 [Pseudomonadales bacterium]|nr:cytochrome c oxidase subunit 3 [Pseudomonadales bacterium]